MRTNKNDPSTTNMCYSWLVCCDHARATAAFVAVVAEWYGHGTAQPQIAPDLASGTRHTVAPAPLAAEFGRA